ncbi:cyclin-dependent kinase 14 isoform X2 [Folsomia candida]|uniref:cyclin-dependent kinase 14 isoform X2 n=1 Tax=Folsomia candida TaxID=158441 RepID=UPI00160514A9|nr:cyclin-dependent kinase 14 isoform X2 [Folsomia candida]
MNSANNKSSLLIRCKEVGCWNDAELPLPTPEDFVVDVSVTMRETKKGLSRVQKLKKRLSRSFGRLAISSKEEDDVGNKFRCNGYSDEFLDRIEPNGNILRAKQHSSTSDARIDWHQTNGCSQEPLPPVSRQLSVSSDSKLLDDDSSPVDEKEEPQVILRQGRRPPRPKSEVFLSKDNRKSKRYSAFGGDSPFGKSEAYIKLEQLGEGSYATVFKGYSNLTNQVVALKVIRLQEEEGTPFTAIREASLLKDLKHANIVILHDIVHTKSTLTFVFEYLHTDLSQYLERHPGGLNPRNVKLFLFQLLRGLAYCHRRRILHRDVKPQNLLLSQGGELKLADFGLARAKSVPSHTYSHEVVTLWYRPPDVLLGSTDYSTSLDTWGVGCIFVEMLTGGPVFPGVRDVSDQLDKIFRVLGTPTEKSWEGVTQLANYHREVKRLYKPQKLGLAFPRLYDVSSAENLAAAFLQLDPTTRLEADEALRHTYFSDLPPKVLELPHEISIFTVEGIKFYPEETRRGLPKTGSFDFRRKL